VVPYSCFHNIHIVVAHKEVLSAKDAYEDYAANKDDNSNYGSWTITKLLYFENESPKIGVSVQKFDIMLDSSVWHK